MTQEFILESKPPSKYGLKSIRFYMALLMMFAIFARCSMRVDMTMAVVCMINNTYFDRGKVLIPENLNITSKCGVLTPEKVEESGYNGDILWTSKDVAYLFSANFYGLLTTVWGTGYLADIFSPKYVAMIALTNSVIISLLTPFLAKKNYWAIFAGRYLMGFGEGFIMPSLLSMASHWFPTNERASFAAIYTSGNQIGAMITVPISSFLCSSEIFGWESIFYFFGSFGLILIILWFLFVSDTPEKNQFITNSEKQYLHETIGSNHKKKSEKIPWKKLLTCVPLYAAIYSQISFSFSLILMQSFLPIYMKQVLQVSLKSNGLISILPFLAQIISKNAIGNIGDVLKKKNILTNTQTVKIFQCFGNIGSGICFLLLAYFIDCDTVPFAMIILGFYGLFIACGIPGFFTALLSIAPKYSGTIGSITLTVGAMTISTIPFFVGYFNKNGTPEEWGKIYLIPVGLHFSSAIIFAIFGSADVQEWAKIKPSSETQNLQEIKKEEKADLFDKLSIAE